LAPRALQLPLALRRPVSRRAVMIIWSMVLADRSRGGQRCGDHPRPPEGCGPAGGGSRLALDPRALRALRERTA
jgi:hypothetical protein